MLLLPPPPFRQSEIQQVHRPRRTDRVQPGLGAPHAQQRPPPHHSGHIHAQQRRPKPPDAGQQHQIPNKAERLHPIDKPVQHKDGSVDGLHPAQQRPDPQQQLLARLCERKEGDNAIATHPHRHGHDDPNTHARRQQHVPHCSNLRRAPTLAQQLGADHGPDVRNAVTDQRHEHPQGHSDLVRCQLRGAQARSKKRHRVDRQGQQQGTNHRVFGRRGKIAAYDGAAAAAAVASAAASAGRRLADAAALPIIVRTTAPACIIIILYIITTAQSNLTAGLWRRQARHEDEREARAESGRRDGADRGAKQPSIEHVQRQPLRAHLDQRDRDRARRQPPDPVVPTEQPAADSLHHHQRQQRQPQGKHGADLGDGRRVERHGAREQGRLERPQCRAARHADRHGRQQRHAEARPDLVPPFRAGRVGDLRHGGDEKEAEEPQRARRGGGHGGVGGHFCGAEPPRDERELEEQRELEGGLVDRGQGREAEQVSAGAAGARVAPPHVTL